MIKVLGHFLHTYGSQFGFWFGIAGRFYQSIVMSIVGSIVLSKMVGQISQGNTNEAVRTLFFYLLLMVSGLAANYITHAYALIKENRYYRVTQRNVYDRLMNKDVSYFRDRHTGYLTKYFRDYADGLLNLTRFLRQDVIVEVVTLFFPPIILTIYNPWIGLITWIVVIVQLIYIRWASQIANKFRKASHEIYRSINGLVSDDITNIIAYKLANTRQKNKKLYALFDKEGEVFTLRHIIPIKLDIPRSLITTVMIGFGYYLAIRQSASSVSAVELAVLIVNYMAILNRSLASFPSLMDKFDDAITKIEPVLDLFDSSYEEITSPKNPKDINTSRGIEITFENVSFSYADDHENVLNNFSLRIAKKQKIGVVGLSGAGKSTLANLILRFDDVTDGRILFNNLDSRELEVSNLRSMISYVPQEPLLFHQSIKDNIKYYNSSATDKEVENAAKIAHIHEYVSSLKNGYETIVGERGVKLSGGQKQRVVIARAILKQSPILLFDEATSALDSESEQAIKDALPEITSNHTAIIIAHRLSTLFHMDRIIVMEKGKIVEDGTHDELVKNNGRYSSLWKKQTSSNKL